MACQSWSETCAVYRFLASPDVEWQDIMPPHSQQTLKRMIGRNCPDPDAALFFDPDEIRGAYLLEKAQPSAPPRLNEALPLIASFAASWSQSHGNPASRRPGRNCSV